MRVPNSKDLYQDASSGMKNSRNLKKNLRQSGLGNRGAFIHFGVCDPIIIANALRIVGNKGSIWVIGPVETAVYGPLNKLKEKSRNLIIENGLSLLVRQNILSDVFWISGENRDHADWVQLIKHAFLLLKDNGTIGIIEKRKRIILEETVVDTSPSPEDLAFKLVASGFSGLETLAWNETQIQITARKPGVGRYICPPVKRNIFVKTMVNTTEKILKKPLEANRILQWSPRNLLGTGVMEMLVTHHDKEIPDRLMNLIRIYVSFRVSCAFCIDLNSSRFKNQGITEDEIKSLRDDTVEKNKSFRIEELTALIYSKCLCQTPVKIPQKVVEQMKLQFSERAFAILAVTIAQVNFWARFIQGLGVGEAGFSDHLGLLELNRFKTRI